MAQRWRTAHLAGQSVRTPRFSARCRKTKKLCRKWHIVRLAQIPENAILRPMAEGIVSFVDLHGIPPSVEVEPEGLYEAPGLGLCAFLQHGLQPGGVIQIEDGVSRRR